MLQNLLPMNQQGASSIADLAWDINNNAASSKDFTSSNGFIFPYQLQPQQQLGGSLNHQWPSNNVHVLTQSMSVQHELQHRQQQQQDNQQNTSAFFGNNSLNNNSSLSNWGSFENLKEPNITQSLMWNSNDNNHKSCSSIINENNDMSFSSLAAALSPTPIKPLMNSNIVSATSLNSSGNQFQSLAKSLKSNHGSVHGTTSPANGNSKAATQRNQEWPSSPAILQTTTTSSTVWDTQDDPYAQSGMLGPWSAFSASRLGEMALSATENGTLAPASSTKKTPKNQDKPKRPLSAYNIFFKEERHRILAEIPDEDAKQSTSTRKRKKRPHGKIGFESLAKAIGKRWQALSDDELAVYKAKAQQDLQRYKQEMKVYAASEVVRKRRAAAAPSEQNELPEPTPLLSGLDQVDSGFSIQELFQPQFISSPNKKTCLNPNMFRHLRS